MSSMTTVLTLVGAHSLGWEPQPGQRVQVPGLDPSYVHTLRDITISDDRTRTTITVDTERPPMLDLVQHLSVLGDDRMKASVRVVDAATGAVLVEGQYDAPLYTGQQVWIGGAQYVVLSIEHPNRHPEHGTVPHGARDWQVATVTALPGEDPVQPAAAGGEA